MTEGSSHAGHGHLELASAAIRLPCRVEVLALRQYPGTVPSHAARAEIVSRQARIARANLSARARVLLSAPGDARQALEGVTTGALLPA